MNKLLIALLISAISFTSYSVYAADSTEDAATTGTTEGQHVKGHHHHKQDGSTDGQHKKHKRNKVQQNKDEKAGTTEGNPLQPTEPQSAPASTH
jgi:Tfp pilus assembly protein PilE